MPVTTSDLIYKGILSKLRAEVTSVHDDFIYISYDPIFTQEDDQYVQLVPGVPIGIGDETGIGIISEEFDVAVWSRLFLDQGTHSTERYANATFGILKVMSEVRSGLISDFITNTLGTIISSLPIVYVRGSRLFESPENPGWCHMTDTYRIGYEIAWGD